MSNILITKDLLCDKATRALLEQPFNSLTQEQSLVYDKYFPLHVVQQFIWLAEQCAKELANNTTFAEDSFWISNISFLRVCFNALPPEFKKAFKQLGIAIKNADQRVMELLPLLSILGD